MLAKRVEALERVRVPSSKIRGWTRAAQAKGVTVPTLRRMVERGEVPPPKVANSYICGKTRDGEDRACVTPEWDTHQLLN